MEQSKHRLFVYGSLRSGFRNPAYKYLTQYFHLLGEGVAKGRMYFNGQTPVAVPTNDSHYLTGELYELNNADEFDWAINQLDDYEGINVMPGESPRYRRDRVTIFQNGQEKTAWIYWYNGSIEGRPEIEMGDVLRYLLEINKHK